MLIILPNSVHVHSRSDPVLDYVHCACQLCLRKMFPPLQQLKSRTCRHESTTLVEVQLREFVTSDNSAYQQMFFCISDQQGVDRVGHFEHVEVAIVSVQEGKSHVRCLLNQPPFESQLLVI